MNKYTTLFSPLNSNSASFLDTLDVHINSLMFLLSSFYSFPFMHRLHSKRLLFAIHILEAKSLSCNFLLYLFYIWTWMNLYCLYDVHIHLYFHLLISIFLLSNSLYKLWTNITQSPWLVLTISAQPTKLNIAGHNQLPMSSMWGCCSLWKLNLCVS